MKKFLLTIALIGASATIQAQSPAKQEDVQAIKLQLVLTQRALVIAQVKDLQAQYERAQAELANRIQANNQALKDLGKDPANFDFNPKTGEFVEKQLETSKSDPK